MACGHVRSVHSLEGELHGNECICLQFPRAPPQSALRGGEEEVEGERDRGAEEQRWVQMTTSGNPAYTGWVCVAVWRYIFKNCSSNTSGSGVACR